MTAAHLYLLCPLCLLNFSASYVFIRLLAQVLIIGGGDGGVLREVLRHPCVESVTQCEIDGKVIELCKKHMPQLSSSYDDPRVRTTSDRASVHRLSATPTLHFLVVVSITGHGAAWYVGLCKGVVGGVADDVMGDVVGDDALDAAREVMREVVQIIYIYIYIYIYICIYIYI